MRETITIRELVTSVAKRWKIIIAITIVVTGIAAGVSIYAIKPLYQSRVKVFVGKEGAEATYNSGDVYMYQNLLKTYSEIIKTDELVKEAILGNPISKTSKEILPNLSVMPREDTQIIQIAYQSDNREETEKIVTLVTEQFIKDSQKLVPNSNVKIIEKARVPGGPVSPNVKMNIMIAFLLSLMGGVGLSLLLEFMDNTVKTTKDIEEMLGISLLGTISIDDPERDKKKIKKQNKKNKKNLNGQESKKEKNYLKEESLIIKVGQTEVQSNESAQQSLNTEAEVLVEQAPQNTQIENQEVQTSSEQTIIDLKETSQENTAIIEQALTKTEQKPLIPRSKRNKKSKNRSKKYDINAGESQ